MDVHLTPDQQAFAAQAIASGRIAREEEAVREALALWEARERRYFMPYWNPYNATGDD